MGKYMRKSKTTGDVLLTDASLGVRTRAKTLALQHLNSSSKPDDSCYLELRSRRLEKSPLPLPSRKIPPENRKLQEEEVQFGDSEIEASCGENNLDFDSRARSTRESTPCSLIRAAADVITPPGSSTKQRSPSRTQNPLLRNIPTALELEEFFAQAEQSQHRIFMEKYNFDVVNDLPLSGRYEWVRVNL